MTTHLTTPLKWGEHVYSHALQPHNNTSDEEKIDFITRNMEKEFYRLYGQQREDAKVDFFYNKDTIQKAIDIMTQAYGEDIQKWIDEPHRKKGDKLQITSDGEILDLSVRPEPQRTQATEITPEELAAQRVGMTITLNKQDNVIYPKMTHLGKIRMILKIDATDEYVTPENPKGAFILSLHPQDDKQDAKDPVPTIGIRNLSKHNAEILTKAYDDVSYIRNGGVNVNDRYRDIVMHMKLTYGEEIDIQPTKFYHQVIKINGMAKYAISPEGISHVDANEQIIPNKPVRLNEEPLRKYQEHLIEFFERDQDISETFPMALQTKTPTLWTGLTTSVAQQPRPPKLTIWRDTPNECILIANQQDAEKRHAIVVSQDGIMVRPNLHSEMEYPCPQNLKDIHMFPDDAGFDKEVLEDMINSIARPLRKIQREQEYIDEDYCITPMTQRDEHEMTTDDDDILLRFAIDSRLEMGVPNKDIRFEM